MCPPFLYGRFLPPLCIDAVQVSLEKENDGGVQACLGHVLFSVAFIYFVGMQAAGYGPMVSGVSRLRAGGGDY